MDQTNAGKNRSAAEQMLDTVNTATQTERVCMKHWIIILAKIFWKKTRRKIIIAILIIYKKKMFSHAQINQLIFPAFELGATTFNELWRIK